MHFTLLYRTVILPYYFEHFHTRISPHWNAECHQISAPQIQLWCSQCTPCKCFYYYYYYFFWPTSTKPRAWKLSKNNGCDDFLFCVHCVEEGDRIPPLQSYGQALLLRTICLEQLTIIYPISRQFQLIQILSKNPFVCSSLTVTVLLPPSDRPRLRFNQFVWHCARYKSFVCMYVDFSSLRSFTRTVKLSAYLYF